MPEILIILFTLGWSSRHRDLVLRRGFAWDTAQGLGETDPGPLGADSTWKPTSHPPEPWPWQLYPGTSSPRPRPGAVVLKETLWQDRVLILSGIGCVKALALCRGLCPDPGRQTLPRELYLEFM